MRLVERQNDLLTELKSVRAANETVALVPTMGNLHAGHTSLIDIARQASRYVVVSIFVNPAQFESGEDFHDYPHTLGADLDVLRKKQVNLIFHPRPNELYPHGTAEHAMIRMPGLDDILCGAFRPNHFAGVATIICKLFNLVRPDIAVLGNKDYQQLIVIKRLVADLDIPVKIHSGETVRDANGLALSSRNQYLSLTEKEQAPLLYQALLRIKASIQQGDHNFSAMENNALNYLCQQGFSPEYVKVRDANNLGLPGKRQLIVLVAAWLGQTRLIDNLFVTMPR